MRKPTHITMHLLLAFTVVLILLPVQQTAAQDKDDNYGKTPSEMLPYGNYQDAYIYHFHEPQLFLGAGREKKAPSGLTEVRLGVLAPLAGNVMAPQGNQLLHGAMLAAEEANARGGYNGLPFKVMPHNDVGLWGAAANEVVKMSDEGAWAILGTIDDVNSHVAIRVALKLEIPMVNSGDPDPTFTETGIPWVIRVIADDRQSSYALVHYIHRKMEHKRVAVLRPDNRYGRVGVMEFRDAALRIGYPLVMEIRFADGDTNFDKQLERIKNSNPDAILLWGNALEMGLIVNRIKEMGLKQPIYASDRSVNPLFLEVAGENAEGIITTCQYNPKADSPTLKAFQENYRKRFDQEPDVFAAHAYDGMNLIIESIYKVGLNKALIRDMLTDLKTFQGYEGVTGEIFLDASWADIGPIWMAEIKDGDYIFSPASWKWK
ncbi:MAG: ABC transporter substrate-binding protein [Bacteroidales bacterium]|nr:ABC transporter substrate-binding protein [Bacteroidales bacterium]